MIYKAFLNRQEIVGFPVKGKETSEIWGGNVLLWKKSGFSILENLRGYVANQKCISANGINMLSVLKSQTSSEGQVIGFFQEASPYVNKILTNGSYSSSTRVISSGNYFYAIKVDRSNGDKDSTISRFYKMDESGNIIAQYSNSTKISNSQNYYTLVRGFVVINDTFYCIVDFLKGSLTGDSQGMKMYTYRNGSGGSVYDIPASTGNISISQGDMSDSFTINGKTFIIATKNKIRSLYQVSAGNVIRITNANYNYRGTDGTDLYFVNTNQKKLYKLDKETLNFSDPIFDTSSDEYYGETWHNGEINDITFVKNKMYASVWLREIVKIDFQNGKATPKLLHSLDSKYTAVLLTSHKGKLIINKRDSNTTQSGLYLDIITL